MIIEDIIHFDGWVNVTTGREVTVVTHVDQALLEAVQQNTIAVYVNVRDAKYAKAIQT